MGLEKALKFKKLWFPSCITFKVSAQNTFFMGLVQSSKH